MIPRSGERAESVDCNVLYLRTRDESWSMLINNADDEHLKGKKWQGGEEQKFAQITYEELSGSNVYFEIVHFYKAYDFKFESLNSFFLSAILPLNRFRVWLDKFGIIISNRRKLVRSERIDILQLILEKSLDDNKFNISAVSLMGLLHTQRWVYHPDRNRQISYNNLLLKSLAENGEIEAVEGGYKITGKALSTLSDFELEVKLHKQSLTQSKAITFLTIALVVVGCVQAYISYASS